MTARADIGIEELARITPRTALAGYAAGYRANGDEWLAQVCEAAIALQESWRIVRGVA